MRSRRISCFHACFFGVFANPSNFFYVANVFLAFFFSVKVQYLNAVMYFYICTNHFARGKVQLAVGVADLSLIQGSLHVCERQTDIIV